MFFGCQWTEKVGSGFGLTAPSFVVWWSGSLGS